MTLNLDEGGETLHLPKKEVCGKAYAPTPFALNDAYALKALREGDATAEQQQRALKFIVESVCGTYDLSYHPDSSRDTDFALGKRFVGQQIVKLLNINPSIYKEK